MLIIVLLYITLLLCSAPLHFAWFCSPIRNGLHMQYMQYCTSAQSTETTQIAINKFKTELTLLHLQHTLMYIHRQSQVTLTKCTGDIIIFLLVIRMKICSLFKLGRQKAETCPFYCSKFHLNSQEKINDRSPAVVMVTLTMEQCLWVTVYMYKWQKPASQ